MNDDLKRQAAAMALTQVRPGMRLGLGTGSTARHFVDLLGEKVAAGFDCICVPTSEVTARQAASLNIPLSDLDTLDLSHVGNRATLLSELVRLEAERVGTAAEYATMSQRLETAEARRIDLIEPAARLEDLQRDFSVAEAVFASAMARTQTSKADLYASYPLVQVLEDPSLPDEPSSPKRKLALAAGIAATFFLLMGLFLAWLRRPLISRLLAEGDAAMPANMVPAE